MEMWSGYKIWHFETTRDSGHISVHHGGETEVVSCRKTVYHRVDALSGDLGVNERSSSIAILKQIAVVVDYLVRDMGMTLWYEPTNHRREHIYQRALSEWAYSLIASGLFVKLAQRRRVNHEV